MHSLMARRDLKTIFDYREQTIKNLLESGMSTIAFHSSAHRDGLVSHLTH